MTRRRKLARAQLNAQQTFQIALIVVFIYFYTAFPVLFGPVLKAFKYTHPKECLTCYAGRNPLP